MTTWSICRPTADVIEKGPDSPATLTREGTDAMRVHARLGARPIGRGAGELRSRVARLVRGASRFRSARTRWASWRSMRRPAIRTSTLAFVTPLENQVGRVVTG